MGIQGISSSLFISHILPQWDGKDLARASCVSTFFYSLIMNEPNKSLVWKAAVERCFLQIHKDYENRFDPDWRGLYIKYTLHERNKIKTLEQWSNAKNNETKILAYAKTLLAEYHLTGNFTKKEIKTFFREHFLVNEGKIKLEGKEKGEYFHCIGDFLSLFGFLSAFHEKLEDSYEKAAKLGDVQARVKRGRLYEEPKNSQFHASSPDKAKAFEYYRQAALQKDPNGQYETARCYERGIGVEQNSAEARKWYRESAYQGHTVAKRIVGLIFKEEVALPNLSKLEKESAKKKAFLNLRDAAAEGDLLATGHLGQCYEKGFGFSTDPEKAFACYLFADNHLGPYRDESDERISVEQLEITFSLAHCYEEGIGTSRNPEKALFFYRKVAAMNSYSSRSFAEQLNITEKAKSKVKELEAKDLS